MTNDASLAGDALEALQRMTDRLHRACLTVSTLPPAGPRGHFSTWPTYRLTWWDEGNEVSKLTEADITRRLIAPPRFSATPREIDDCLPALALLDGLTRQHRNVVRFRALQRWYGEHVDAGDEALAHWRGGWRAIGRLTKCSHTNARNLHNGAMGYALDRFRRGSAASLAGVSKAFA